MKLVLALLAGVLLLAIASSRPAPAPAPPPTPRVATSAPTLRSADFFDDCDELAESPEKWECERDAGRAWRGYEEMILDDRREAYDATRYAEGPYDPGSDEDDAPWR
jgi:hypothetical protein